MIPAEQKIERMIAIARMYYEQDMNQSQIAKELGISRPLVSVLLTEAKACGIVKITINDIGVNREKMAKCLKERFDLNHVILVLDANNAGETNKAVANEAFFYCFGKKNANKSVGIGWGSMMGCMADLAETMDDEKRNKGYIFPLTGGISSVIRGYHTNEIVRMIGEKTGTDVHYLYFPAFFDETADLEYIKGMEDFQFINQLWNSMDVALISISNYPSYPDVGVKYRFGNDLMKKNAVGRLLAYYYDIQGNLIAPWINGAMQPDMQQLRSSGQVVAVCSTQLRPECVIGALCTNVIKTILIPESLAKKVIQTLTTE